MGRIKIKNSVIGFFFLQAAILMLIPGFSVSQEGTAAIEILKLEKELEKSTVSRKASLQNMLSEKYLKLNPEKARIYATEALRYAKITDDRAGEIKATINLGKAFFELQVYDSTMSYYQKTLAADKLALNDTIISELNFLMSKVLFEQNAQDSSEAMIKIALETEKKLNRPEALLTYLYFQGKIYYSIADYQAALIALKKAADLAQTLGDKKTLSEIRNRIGIIYSDLGSFEEALEHYLKSLEIVEELDNKIGISNALNNIGVVYHDWGNKEKALEFYQKSLKIVEEAGSRISVGYSYNNIGLIYHDWEQYDIAIQYYDKALEIFNEFRDEDGMADVLNNMGESLFEQGDHEKGLEYLFRSLDIEKKLGNKYGIAESFMTLGLYSLKLSDINKAIEYNTKSFSIADSLNLPVLLVENYNLFYKIYEKKKNYALALEYYRNYSNQRDSLYDKQFHNKLAEVQAKYEIDRYDKERAEMSKQVLDRTKEVRNQKVYLIVILLLMIVFGILVYFDIKSKVKANARLKLINNDLNRQKELLTKTLGALGKSEAKYKNLVENSPTGILYIDSKGNILEVNRKTLEILGSPSEAATKQINCLTFPLLQKVGLSDAIIKSINTREVVYNECPYTSKWGKQVYLRYYITPIPDAQDRISDLIITIEDFTQKREAELLKIQSDSQYKVLVENSLQAMLIIQDGRLIFANSRLEELTQYKFFDLAGKGEKWLQALIHPEDAETAEKNIGLSFETKNLPARNEYKFIRKDRTVGWLETLGSVVDYNGKPAILLVAVDITDRKQGESILIESEKQLRQANAMKDKFFSLIAHDLKNPFGSILGFSNLLVEAYDNFDDKQRKSFIKNISEVSENTFKLLQNLLEWSKTQTGKFEFKPVKIDIKEIAEENISVLKSAAGNKKIRVYNKVDSESKAYADENMVKAIIRNLLTNAIKFTHHHGKVEISTKNSGDFIEICIADNGKGISPEDQTRLFRIDDQFKTLGTDHEEGSGLGLILCKEFVEKHNGKIWVESKPGSGSKFKFTLPSV
jgi:PAS domain S-box-containing protein